jgi:2-amino-4-hydroxy-6-hydroxymethyldihydropteridine diphosphokinase
VTLPSNRAYLGLGSNVDAERHLVAASRELLAYGTIVAASTVWETEPVGFSEQANFLNGALLLQTGLSVDELRCDAIPAIERLLDRRRDPDNVNGPRTIDIDIALFNREIIDRHHIPDPDIFTRRFVAQLLAELEPDYVHPVSGQTLREIADSLDHSPPRMWARADVVLATSPRQSSEPG